MVSENMSLLERARKAWVALTTKNEPERPEPTGVVSTSGLLSVTRDWREFFSIDPARSARYADFNQMDTGDVATMLDQVVQATLTFDGNDDVMGDPLLKDRCFKIELPGKYGVAGPRTVLRHFLTDSGIREAMPAVLRDVLKYGDEFSEPLVDDYGNVVGIVPYPVEEIRVRRDAKGRLISGPDEDGNGQAYQQVYQGKILAGFFPGELVHLKLYPSAKRSYSEKGMLDDMRAAWKKLDWEEQSMVVARVTRAYPRNKHKIDTTSKSDQEAKDLVRKYMNSLSTREAPSGTREQVPFQPHEDLYLTTGYMTLSDGRPYQRLSDIELLDPNIAALGNIKDVEYLRGKLHLRHPAEMLGIGGESNQELSSQDIAWSRFVRYLQQNVLEDQFIRPLIDMALALKGYYGVPYRVIWPDVTVGSNWKTGDALFRVTLAFNALMEGSASSRRQAMKYIFGLSDDKIDEVFKEIEDENKRFGPVSTGGRSGKQVQGNKSN